MLSCWDSDCSTLGWGARKYQLSENNSLPFSEVDVLLIYIYWAFTWQITFNQLKTCGCMRRCTLHHSNQGKRRLLQLTSSGWTLHLISTLTNLIPIKNSSRSLEPPACLVSRRKHPWVSARSKYVSSLLFSQSCKPLPLTRGASFRFPEVEQKTAVRQKLPYHNNPFETEPPEAPGWIMT